jgi:hypothetical protein
MKHPVKNLRFPKAAVETVAELRHVTRQMLGTDAMMDASDIAFNIGDQVMDPGQNLRRFFTRTGHYPLMLEISRGIQEAITLPAIGLDYRLSG